MPSEPWDLETNHRRTAPAKSLLKRCEGGIGGCNPTFDADLIEHTSRSYCQKLWICNVTKVVYPPV